MFSMLGTAHAAGALVFGSANGQCWALGAYNDTSKLEAIGEAMKECNKRGACSVAIEFVNSCAAIAVSPLCSWNAASRWTLEQAQSSAMANCIAQGHGPCTIYSSACDTVPETTVKEVADVASRLESEKQQLSASLREASAARDQLLSQLATARNDNSRLEAQASSLRRTADEQTNNLARAQDQKALAEAIAKERDAAVSELKAFNERDLGDLMWLYASNTWRHTKQFAETTWVHAVDAATRSWLATRSSAIATWEYIRDLPTSTHVAGGVAAFSMLIASAALAVAVRRTTPAQPDVPRSAKKRRRSLFYKLRRRWISFLYSVRRYKPPQAEAVSERTAASPSRPPTPNLPVPVPTFLQPQQPDSVDTPAALRALKLAASYIAEVPEEINFGDEEIARTSRTTLALAAKQLDIAHQADPNAALGDDDGKMEQRELRAMLLMRESLTWYPHNQAKAIRIIGQAKEACPEAEGLWFWSGWYNYEQRNKAAAIADLERALQLDPDHIQAMKLLDRAQNMGGGEIALFKVTNARDNTLFGIVKTINILRIPFLIVTFPFRVMFWFARLVYVSFTDPWRAMRGDF